MIRPRLLPIGVLADDRSAGACAERLELATRLDLGPGDLWFVETLASLQPTLRDDDRDLLVQGLLRLLAALETGSTLLPLSEASSLEAETHARLLALLTDPLRAGAIVADLRYDTTPGEATAPDATRAREQQLPARPLLLLPGDALALRRVHEQEYALAGRLRERLGDPMNEGQPAPEGLSRPLGESDASRLLLELDHAAATEAVDAAIASPGPDAVQLTSEQREACIAALASPLTVITGGPGTGKTTIVATLLRAIALAAPGALPAIALTAPTGKAADRLSTVARAGNRASQGSAQGHVFQPDAQVPAATTLHRLLGYRPRSDTFSRHENNPLETALLICDEASMIDLHLMDRLLRALQPGARLLLLGDAQQLPPVRAGAVLGDLVRAPRAQPVIHRLTHSHRQTRRDPSGAAILRAAAALLAGDAAVLLGQADPAVKDARASGHPSSDTEAGPALRRVCTVGDLRFEGAELLELDSAAARAAFLSAWAARHLDLPPELEQRLHTPPMVAESGLVKDDDPRLRALLAHHERARLLCVTRVPAGGSGTTAVNASLAGHLARSLGQAPGRLAPGTPVMVTTNDYDRGLFNGDTGLLLCAHPAESPQPIPMALFAGPLGIRAFSLQGLAPHLEPAFAITVHKAQGSEYDEVAILLPAIEVRGLTRELLYTALTRARRAALFVGQTGRLVEACARSTRRHTALPELLE